MFSPKKQTIIAFVVAGTTACYGYYPLPMGSSLDGKQLELSLTDSGAVVLAPRIGNGMDAISGTLAADSAGVYRMAVFGARRRDGQEIDWKGENVNVPHSLVARVRERRFSSARTSLFAVATGVALIALKSAFSGAGGATVPGPTPGPPGGGSQ